MQNLFEILLLPKISGCILIFLKKSISFLGNSLTPLQIYSKDFKYFYEAPHFNDRIKIRIFWHVWKASSFIHTNFSFSEYKKAAIREDKL